MKKAAALALALVTAAVLWAGAGAEVPGVLADFTQQASELTNADTRNYAYCYYDWDEDGEDELFFIQGLASSDGTWPMNAVLFSGPTLKDVRWSPPKKFNDVAEILTVCMIDIDPADGSKDLVFSIAAPDGKEETMILRGVLTDTDSAFGEMWKDPSGNKILSGRFNGVADGNIVIGGTMYAKDEGYWLKETGTIDPATIPGFEAAEPAEAPAEPAEAPAEPTEAPAEPAAAPAAPAPAPAAKPLDAGEEAYVGEWHLIYVGTGGFTGNAADIGLVGETLQLNEDRTGILSVDPDRTVQHWQMEDGIVRMDGQRLILLREDILQVGSEMSGYMIFSRDPQAVWDGSIPLYDPFAAAEPETAEVPAAPAPAADPAALPGSGQIRTEVKYTAKSFISGGYELDASALGGEYSVILHADGTAEFTMVGTQVPGLQWKTDGEAAVIDYFGSGEIRITADGDGIALDFLGSMILKMVP